MESAYEVHERFTYMTRVRVALLIGLAAVLTYLVLDVWVLDTPAPVTQFRVFVGLPLMALAFALSFYLKRSFFPMLAGLLAIVLVGFSATLLFGGRELTTFAVTAYVQSLLYFSVLAMVPFRYLVLVALPCTVLMIGSLLLVDSAAAALPNHLSLIISIAMLLGFVVYMREKAQRSTFVRRQRTETLHRNDLLRQADQIDWLRNLPAQLERDMQNCLFAIETELDGLMDANPLDEAALGRARRGIHDMMKMFETARFASSVDVVQQQHEPLDLSRVIHQVVLDRSREMEDVHAIELDIQSDLWVHGNTELIRQSVIQILNGATADVQPETLLQIVLRSEMQVVVLEVQVQEELVSLGPNMLTNEHFQLGLGLYLARKIFEMHSGEFEVIAENGKTRFTAKLPLPAPSGVTEESLADQTR